MEKNILYFNEQECPESLAFIFKNIQSLTEFKKLPDNLKKTVINKKGMNLENKIEKYTRLINVNNQSKNRNLGIVSKRVKYLYSLKGLLNQKEFRLITRSFEVIGGVEWATTLIPYLSSLIQDKLDFQTILQYLTPRYCRKVCERLESKICSIIQNPSDITVLTKLMPEQRTAVYEVIKTPLHSVIKDSIDFIKCVFSVSTLDQRAIINKMLKKQFPTIIKNVDDFDSDSFSDLNYLIIYEGVAEKVGSSLVAFNKFLKNLETFEQCTIVCKALKKKLFTLINNPSDFQTILYGLTEQPLALSKGICGVFKEKLFSLITNPFSLGIILENLNFEQCLMIFNMVKAESSLIIESPLDFGNTLQCFIPEYSMIVIELISEQLSQCIKSPTDLNAYLGYVTNSEQCRVLCKLIKEKPLFIKNISDLQNILHELAGELHAEIFKEFKEHLPSVIHCTSDLHIILESSPESCYTIVLAALKEKLSSIKVKNASDFKKLLKFLDLKQRTVIFNSFKIQLYSIIESVSDLNNILINLSPEECGIVCEMVKEKFIAMTEDDKFLSGLLIYLNPEQCAVICAVFKEKILSSKNSPSFEKNLKLLDPDQRILVNTIISEKNSQLEEETQNLNTIIGLMTMGIFPDKNNYHNAKIDHALPSYLDRKL